MVDIQEWRSIIMDDLDISHERKIGIDKLLKDTEDNCER